MRRVNAAGKRHQQICPMHGGHKPSIWKKATSAKYNKTRPACTDVTGLVRVEPDDMHTALSTAPGTSRALNKWYLLLLLAELF